jgi:hypothetical protein
MDPVDWEAWVRVTRDVLIVLVGTFIMVFETVFAAMPSIELIGAGLALLGAPAALRLDNRWGDKRQSSGEDDDKWSHLP